MPWSKVRTVSVAAVMALGGLSLSACATNNNDRFAALETRISSLESSSAQVGQRTDAAAQTAERAAANNAQRIEQLESRVNRLEQSPLPARTPRN